MAQPHQDDTRMTWRGEIARRIGYSVLLALVLVWAVALYGALAWGTIELLRGVVSSL